MRKHVKWLGLAFLVAMMLCATTVCAAAYTAGAYTASSMGNNGDVTVKVTFTDSAIESIDIVSHSETLGISDAAFEKIPEAIVAGQTLAIDAVSGCTMSSNAILTAVENCVEQAGGNVEALMTPVETVQETIDPAERKAEVEVLIIGGGGTGLASAVSAYENGAQDIMVVEKLNRVGGSTALSGGIQGATSTRYKKSQGVTDTDADWLADWVLSQDADLDVLGITCEYPNYDRVSELMKQATVTVDWVESYLGQQYTESLIDYGNATKRVHILAEAVNGDVQMNDAGNILITRMSDFLKDKEQVDLRLGTRGTELITNEAGDVVGAVVEDEYGPYEVYASRGVVLATGGFPYDHELLSKYLPVFDEAMDLSVASSGNTGDGIKMALAVGAAEYPDPFVIGFGAGVRGANLGEFASPVGLATKMMVDPSGKRFVNEGLAYSAITIALSLADTPTWAITDCTDSDIALVDAAVNGTEIVKADTIADLAAAIGVDAQALEATVARYNEQCDTGFDDDFGKSSALYGVGGSSVLRAVREAPFYAVQVHPSNAGTIGGVVTDWNFQVLREDGSVINGLYAGGECSNREYYAYTYMSGSGVTVAMTSGRIIGARIMGQ